MAARKRHSVVREPVHGDVYLTHEELALLDTPEMQRLRGIKQLGTAHLVYPGAVHTRFEHSIGTVHVAQRLIDAINRANALDPAVTLGIGEEEARVIRLAALLHDVTHVPYGHNIEDQDGLFERHDSAHRYRRMFDRSRALGRTLDDIGAKEDVYSVLVPEGAVDRRATPPYWSQVISGTIAADILDYLARDAYFTGLRLQVDPRVTSYFKVERTGGNLYIDLSKHELLREDILSEIVRMLEARYYFSERVYYHHAKVSAGALLAKAVDLAVREGELAEDDLYDQTDASILTLLERAVATAPQGVRALVHDLLERFAGRRLYKRACVFPRYENEAAQDGLVERFFALGGGPARTESEERMADLVRFATGRDVRLIVYCPARRMQLKEARIHVRWPGEAEIRPLSTFADRIPRLADLERSYRDLWKFYVFADTPDRALLEKVREVATVEFREATNAYRG